MTARYRVTDEGLRVINPDGSSYSLPPGTVLDEIPHKYEGSLEVIAWKRLDDYEDKMLRPAATKATPKMRPDPRLSNCVLEGGRQKDYPQIEDGE